MHSYHYPPELIELLVGATSKLLKGKQGLLDFFAGCGVPRTLLSDLQKRVTFNKESIYKTDISRAIIMLINEKGDKYLGQRRKLLQRVTEWDNYSTCFPKDMREAKGFVAEICDVVKKKDTFTRIVQERDKERDFRRAKEAKERKRITEKRNKIAGLKEKLFSLFKMKNAHKRGIELEGVLNELFEAFDICVRESFRRVGDNGEGTVEQIDGVIELKGEVYLVEMKWHKEPVGVPELSPHLVRVYNRGSVGGIFISASGYTKPAILGCKDALVGNLFVLCELEEIVSILNSEGNIRDWLDQKVIAAKVDKNPHLIIK